MAEGLIPFVYRAIKRRKSISRYHSLPPSAAAAVGAAARIPEDHAVDPAAAGENYRGSLDGTWTPTTLQLGGRHRRWATVDDLGYEDECRRQQQNYYYTNGALGPQQPPLAKARSSRVFSCITGM